MRGKKPRLFIDQRNHAWIATSIADLAQQLGYRPGTAKRMFVDRRVGQSKKTYHVGYVIGQYWVNEFEFKPVEREA